MTTLDNFPIIIRQSREEAGLTQKELAALINVSSKYISAIENNRQTVSIQKLQEIAKALNKKIMIEFVDL